MEADLIIHHAGASRLTLLPGDYLGHPLRQTVILRAHDEIRWVRGHWTVRRWKRRWLMSTFVQP